MKNTKIMIIDGYEFELVYIDSTHFKAKNLSLGNNRFVDYVVYHIGQFQGVIAMMKLIPGCIARINWRL